MKAKFKKPILLSLVLLLVLSPLSIGQNFQIQKNKAQAIVITGGRLNFLDFIARIPSLEVPAQTTAIATANIAGQQKLEYVEGFALAALRRQLINRVVDDIINWINGGGEPRFVTDWEGFLSDAAGLATGAAIQELGLGFLCSPFSAQVQIAVAATAQRQNFSNILSCTLDDIVGNIENFYNNFSSGGWIGYYEAWQPQNNFFGSYLIAQEEVNRRAFEAREASRNEAIAGGGILSTKRCKERGDTSNPASGPDIDGDGLYGDYDCEITTPGSIIQDLLGKALGVDIDLILKSEQLPDYVANIANALINRIIREGVNGLRGLTANTSPGSDFVIPSPAETPCDGLEGDLLIACLSYQGIISVSFESSRQSIIDDINEALSPREEALAIMEESKILLEEHLGNLEEKQASCSSAEEFISLVSVEVEMLIAQIQFDATAITSLQDGRTELMELEPNSWGDLTRIQFELVGLTNKVMAESLKETAELKQEEVRQKIRSQENTCNINSFFGI